MEWVNTIICFGKMRQSGKTGRFAGLNLFLAVYFGSDKQFCLSKAIVSRQTLSFKSFLSKMFAVKHLYICLARNNWHISVANVCR